MLELRLLGEIEVLRDGERLALPPSRKTRALLGYLAANDRPHRRERLCTLLWDVPDDPRGALRWSLSRLRGVLNDGTAERIRANRDTVTFAAAGATVDLAAVRARSRGIDEAATADLVALAGSFRGEFLEGIDLPDLYDFQAWLVAEREDLRRLEAGLLTVLAERFADAPDEALPHARRLVQIDPYNAAGRAALVRHLAALGREAEAEQHYAAGRQVLREVGEGAELRLVAAWRETRSGGRASIVPAVAATDPAAPAPPPPAPAAAPRSRFDDSPPLVGRETERSELADLVDHTLAGGPERIVLLSGEPGLGKSRLLDCVVETARERGLRVLRGRAYEADRGHPYSLWSDAAAEIGVVVPVPEDGFGRAADSGRKAEREAMLAAASRTIAGDGPLLIALDDLQWCDDASAELLHLLLRSNRASPLLIVLAARDGELPDNPAILAVLRSLRHDRIFAEMRLEPLAPEDAATLVRATVPAADAAAIASASAGSPLFAIELARGGEGGTGLPRSLRTIVRDRIDRLPPLAAEVLRWASAIGPCFSVDRLVAAAAIDADAVAGAIETLERHGLLSSGGKGGRCDIAFAHDVVHRAVYDGLSEPRRRLMHLRIARVIEAAGIGDDAVAAELGHHATLGGDAGIASAACVQAGRRALRLYAYSEAAALARRGMRHAASLAPAERVQREIELTQVALRARNPDSIDAAAGEVEALAERAIDLGCLEHARLAFHMLSYLRWEGGAWSDAHRNMLRAEAVGRATDQDRRVVALGEAARCLAMLERDLVQADALLLEARALARRLEIETSALFDAAGMLRLHKGDLVEAEEAFRRAHIVARCDGDRMSEFLALEHLAELEIGRSGVAGLGPIAAEMVRLAEKLPAGSELPYARCLATLADAEAGSDDVARSIEALRRADAKHRLALCLRIAAGIDLAAGRPHEAAIRADEALGLAALLDRPSDIALSRILVARAALAAQDPETAEPHLIALGHGDRRPVSAHAAAAATALLAEVAGSGGLHRAA